ncbi:MAG: methionyl-tRNA formyltransferase, partial [Marinilabiliales bacterium]
FNIAALVTAPDKPAGRGQKIKESAVKKYAASRNLRILQPTNMKSDEFLESLRFLNPDLQIVVAFRMMPEVVWSLPRFGTFNLHASLLPQYRGAAPINWAIINGEKETGVTTFFLKHEIDTGAIIYQEKVIIDINDTAGTLHDKLMEIGAKLVVKTAKDVFEGRCEAKEQNEMLSEELKHAPKIFKDNCKINWSLKGHKIYDFIRGLSPYPNAWTELVNPDGKRIAAKIIDVEFSEGSYSSDIEIQTGKNLEIAVNGGKLKILKIQPAGKKAMSGKDLMNGIKDISQYSLQ